MIVTLVLQCKVAAEIFDTASLDVETAGVLLARQVETPEGNIRLLGRTVHWVAEDAYLRRDATGLSITSNGYVSALAAAEVDKSVPIWLHTHPGENASPRPSASDLIVDEQLADLFRLRASSPIYGSIIFARAGDHICFTGHIESENDSNHIDRLWITGRRFILVKNWLYESVPPSVQFDRNIRAFGDEIQRVIGDLQVAVIGCGGTGSAVIEQLVRLGVRKIQIFDPKNLTDGNITRVYGSYIESVGKPKVNVIEAHLNRIAPDAKVKSIQQKITHLTAAKLLLDADIVFGCTDDNAGRLVLSRIATYLLTPVIDCGVLLSSDLGGNLIGIDGRITVVAPGTACLVCRNRIDLQRASAEMLSPDEHIQLVEEGYAPALPEPDPAVIAFTTQVASAAVAELLERLIHYGPDPEPTEILLRAHEREYSTNEQKPRKGHYCHPHGRKHGLGVTDPFLEQLW